VAHDLRNPFTGQTITFVEENDDLLVMESSYEAGGAPAPAHLHPAQDERFTVLAGSVVTRIGDEERVLREGDVVEIPAGTPHVFGGNPEEAGTVRWEVRPPLRTRAFFEHLFAGLNAAEAGETLDEPFDFADYEDVFRLP
jgi:quercetin dioxygenase-like cupin family protein